MYNVHVYFVLIVYCVVKSFADTNYIQNTCSYPIFSPLFKASQGDIGHAVGLLTTQPAEVQDPGEPQESGTSGETWEGQKGTFGTKQAFSYFKNNIQLHKTAY